MSLFAPHVALGTRWETDDEKDARQRFAKDTSEFAATSKHSDGLYRHVRFRDPKRSFYWFDLITWPGALCFRGDMGTWVFVRDTDMAEFFRSSNYINTGYWAEKVTAGKTHGYDPDHFKRTLLKATADGSKDCREAAKRLIADDCASWRHDLHEARLELAELDRHHDLGDWWEWELETPTVQFLWALNAIHAGCGWIRADEAGR